MEKIEVGQCKDCRWWEKDRNDNLQGGCLAIGKTRRNTLCIAAIDECECEDSYLTTMRFFGCVMFEPRSPE